MAEIAHRRPITIKRKYVYWLVQFMFVVALIGFLYAYMTNIDPFKGVTNIQAAANGEPAFVKVIYGKFGGGEMDKPMAVTVSNERIYVSDTNNKRVQIFDYEGNPIKTFGERGTAPGQFLFPYGLAGDSKGVIYVADLYNGTVSKFDKDGKFLGLFAEKNPAEKVFEGPAGIAIKDDKIYVTDVKQNVLKVFDINGNLIRTIGKPGRGDGELNAPNAVTVDGEGIIYVTDTGNQRVQIFDQNGKFMRIVNGSVDGKGQSVFVNPRGIGVDDKGNIYVVNNLTHRFHIFDKTGKTKFVIGEYGEGEKQFSLPNGLFIDERGRIYITDSINQRVAVFQS